MFLFVDCFCLFLLDLCLYLFDWFDVCLLVVFVILMLFRVAV